MSLELPPLPMLGTRLSVPRPSVAGTGGTEARRRSFRAGRSPRRGDVEHDDLLEGLPQITCWVHASLRWHDNGTRLVLML